MVEQGDNVSENELKLYLVIVDEVRRYMVEQGDNVSENELKLYLAIKNVCNRLRRGEQDARDSAYTFGSRYC